MKIRLASIASAGLLMVGCNSTQNEHPRISSFPKPNVSLCVHNALQACVEVPAIIPTSSNPIIASVIDDLAGKAATIAEVGVSLDPTNPCSRSQPYKISGVFKPNPNFKTDGLVSTWVVINKQTGQVQTYGTDSNGFSSKFCVNLKTLQKNRFQYWVALKNPIASK